MLIVEYLSQFESCSKILFRSFLVTYVKFEWKEKRVCYFFSFQNYENYIFIKCKRYSFQLNHSQLQLPVENTQVIILKWAVIRKNGLNSSIKNIHNIISQHLYVHLFFVKSIMKVRTCQNDKKSFWVWRWILLLKMPVECSFSYSAF